MNKYLESKTVSDLNDIVASDKATAFAIDKLLSDVFEPEDNFMNINLKKQRPIIDGLIKEMCIKLVDEYAHDDQQYFTGVTKELYHAVRGILFEVLYYKALKGYKLDAHLLTECLYNISNLLNIRKKEPELEEPKVEDTILENPVSEPLVEDILN